jgi:hypothetical protein
MHGSYHTMAPEDRDGPRHRCKRRGRDSVPSFSIDGEKAETLQVGT